MFTGRATLIIVSFKAHLASYTLIKLRAGLCMSCKWGSALQLC